MKSIIIIISLIYCTFIVGQGSENSSKTVDAEINNVISGINDRAKTDFDGFKKDMSQQFGISASDVDRYVKQDDIAPGDVYFGSVLARTSNKSISDVMNRYKNTRGWGKLAKDLGIQPGSEQFHNLKKNALMHPGNNSGNGDRNEVKFEKQNSNQKSNVRQNKTGKTSTEFEQNTNTIKSQKQKNQSNNEGKVPNKNKGGKK